MPGLNNKYEEHGDCFTELGNKFLESGNRNAKLLQWGSGLTAANVLE